MTISTIYLRTVFYPEVFPLTVDKTIAAAKQLKEKYDYDTIAFCGMSGAAMAFILAHTLKIPLLCVRKESDGSHFWGFGGPRSPAKKSPLEGFTTPKRYLIVDDFISSGYTVNYIMDSIRKDVPNAECVAMLMYSTHDSYNWPLANGKEIEVVASRPESI